MTKDEVLLLRERVRPFLDENRYRHTLGVEKEIRFLAKLYMTEREEELAAAALLHDITKKMPIQEQIELCRRYGDYEEVATPQLLHAQSAIPFITAHFSEFATPLILQAVKRHTTGDVGMEVADMLLYLADFTEEGRTYKDCISLRQMLHDGLSSDFCDRMALLHRVLLRAYDLSIGELVEEKRPISVKTIAARNDLLQKMKK
jgi:predicted HD superfamily hydrolase involved in NAD metabolism